MNNTQRECFVWITWQNTCKTLSSNLKTVTDTNICITHSLFWRGCLGSSLRRSGPSLCHGGSFVEAQGLYLWRAGSVVVAEGLVAPRHVGVLVPWPEVQTCVPCIARWILNHLRYQGSPYITHSSCYPFLQPFKWQISIMNHRTLPCPTVMWPQNLVLT